MALEVSQKAMPAYYGLPKAPIGGTRSGGDLDYDLLVTRVENTIHEDKHHSKYGLTPQELMMKSNPALYQPANPANRDLANPREVYNILSHKSKSIEDLAAKLKQELARSVQTTGSLPKLSRALSMNDIEHKADKANHRVGHRTDSHANPRRKLDVLALKRHNTTAHETHKTEKKPALNLPNIERKSGRNDENNAKQDDNKPGYRQRNELEQLTERTESPGGENDTVNKKVEFSDSKNVEEKGLISKQDAKLNKWFSEMPNEVFDKAQRALMEESIKDRLQDFQKRRRKKYADFPHPTYHVCVGPKVRKVPNTYLELQVDSFGKHITQNEKEDKLAKYKLRQRSMHNLKMRESTDVDQYDKITREETFPKLIIQNRSLTTMTGTKPRKPEPESPRVIQPKKESISRTDTGFNTVYMNDTIGPSDFVQNSKSKHGPNNYEEYTERLVMMKEMSTEFPNIESPRFYQHGDNTEKDVSKAAIVNLTLEQNGLKQKKKHHLEKPIVAETIDIVRKDEEEDAHAEDVVNNEEDDEGQRRADKIITKIPTAQSIRTSDTRSSNSSIMSKSNKEALKRFNKLEVFAESKLSNEGMPARDIFSKGKPHLSGDYVPAPPNKQDAKHQQQQQRRYVQGNNDAILLQEPRKHESEVTFRFEPGEVFIQRKMPHPLHGNTRCSERARIIYGKTIQGATDKSSVDTHRQQGSTTTNKKKDTNIGNSAMTKSTRIDGYRSEFSQYENRALNESPGTISPRQDDGAMNHSLIVKSSAINRDIPAELKLTRDVATETDLLGSARDSKSPRNADDITEDVVDDRHGLYNNTGVLTRSDSELEQFIEENNDGESLESDDDGDDVGVIHREIHSTVSV